MDELWLAGGGLAAEGPHRVAVRLGMVIARAGEGTIFEIEGHPHWVAKVFHDDLNDRHLKCAKVAAMVDSPPPGAVQSDGFAVLTWPLHTLVGPTGPTGYVMHRIDTSNAVEIHTISNPANRAKPLPTAPQWTPHVTWLHLVNVAANLCLAVEVVHRVDAVIGDFQERNILVNDTTRVTLVDCDSMQFTDTTGHQYLCGVGRPEFTAPELAGLNLATTARHKPSDLFALAVHIHLLLMAGNHPFLRGTWTGPGEQPDAMSLAKSGWWAGGPNSPLHTHPVAPPPQFLPDNIQRLFYRAFTTGAHDPASRPTAHEWRTALQGLQIRTCPHGHQVPVETEHCPWCHIDTQRTARKAQHTYTTTTQPHQTVYPVTTTTTDPTPPTTTPPRNTTKYLLAAAAILAILITTIVVTTNRTTTTTTATTITATATATAIPDWETATTTTRASGPTVSPNALNVSVPMSHPPCDGLGIVVLANAVTPGRYDSEIQRALDAYPGSSYLRTDESCASLRKRDDAGNPIYAVYRPAGRTVGDICAAVRAAGGNAYGKWLDMTTDPKYMIPC
ncbi:hypothetical protein [Mycobacterium sp. DL592]|uniref:hypothetical protein n=1 Tax=Mycobacterium sp. DL592 TaxID=2675524 RepID=UPI00141F77C1|nr:hypothetical protein [Mycobacterium sp. DL592]